MEIISRISKGSKMDQAYIPKNRMGLNIGSYVSIRPLENHEPIENPYFYNVKDLEQIKLQIIKEIIKTIDESLDNYENIIITGSFLDKGFNFNDIDIIVITEDKTKMDRIKTEIERETGIPAHVLIMSNKELITGLKTDPIYHIMLSRCIAKKRFIYKKSQKIDYKLLDLHLLNSKLLLDNFDSLDGNEKYYLVRNMISIYLYLNKRKITDESVKKEIRESFGLKDIQKIKQNLVDKKDFLRKYKLIYDKSFAKILEGLKHHAKQEQIS